MQAKEVAAFTGPVLLVAEQTLNEDRKKIQQATLLLLCETLGWA